MINSKLPPSSFDGGQVHVRSTDYKLRWSCAGIIHVLFGYRLIFDKESDPLPCYYPQDKCTATTGAPFTISPTPIQTMMTSSNGNIFRVTGPLCGEFTGPGEFPTQRPVTRSFYVFFDLRLNKRLSKQSWGWWFETPSWSLWRHCNAMLPSIPLRTGANYLPTRV